MNPIHETSCREERLENLSWGMSCSHYIDAESGTSRETKDGISVYRCSCSQQRFSILSVLLVPGSVVGPLIALAVVSAFTGLSHPQALFIAILVFHSFVVLAVVIL